MWIFYKKIMKTLQVNTIRCKKILEIFWFGLELSHNTKYDVLCKPQFACWFTLFSLQLEIFLWLLRFKNNCIWIHSWSSMVYCGASMVWKFPSVCQVFQIQNKMYTNASYEKCASKFTYYFKIDEMAEGPASHAEGLRLIPHADTLSYGWFVWFSHQLYIF